MPPPADFACDYMDVPAFLRKEAVPPEPERERLSPERVTRVRQALRVALDELLFADIPSEFSIWSLMDRIDPQLHDDVHQYLEESSLDLWNEDDACRLLEELAEAGIGAELTDDQEARLAVWRHEAA